MDGKQAKDMEDLHNNRSLLSSYAQSIIRALYFLYFASGTRSSLTAPSLEF